MTAARRCAWCGGPIPLGARRDAVYCGTPHRQAAHRFGKLRRRRSGTFAPRRFAYADPPYPRKARACYGATDPHAAEVDHGILVARLVHDYPDGWALSTSADALQDVLALCPAGVDVAAWFRGERAVAHHAPLSAWEPVIVCGGRTYPTGPGPDERRTDALQYRARPRTTDPRRVIGAKPAAFAWWLFDLLGALPGDDLDDLYPGSGGIARAWALYTASGRVVRPHDATRRLEIPTTDSVAS